MRILDEQGNEIENPDLEIGYLVNEKIVKPGAYETIDNMKKFVLADDDYEEIIRYRVIDEQERISRRIQELKRNLSESDYIAAKTMDTIVLCNTASKLLTTLGNVRAEYADKIEERQKWRDEINDLEAQLASVADE